MKYINLIAVSFLILAQLSCAESKPSQVAKQAVEIGNVKWLRNYEQALKKAKTDKKPLLIFFQEVPG